MSKLLDREKQERLDIAVPRFQAVAIKMPDRAKLGAVDTSAPLKLCPQMEALGSRICNHMREVLSEEGGRYTGAVFSGINDYRAAIEGIKLAVKNQGTHDYSSGQKADIARHSFGVLHRYASDRTLELKVSDSEVIVNPERLKFVEEPVAFVRTRATDDEPTYGYMPCPAFIGTAMSSHYMAAKLWPVVIDLYEACGELG